MSCTTILYNIVMVNNLASPPRMKRSPRSRVVQHGAGDRGVVVQEGPDAFRHGEHPLAHGKRRQDVIDEMGGGLDHRRVSLLPLWSQGVRDRGLTRTRRHVGCIPDGEAGPVASTWLDATKARPPEGSPPFAAPGTRPL